LTVPATPITDCDVPASAALPPAGDLPDTDLALAAETIRRSAPLPTLVIRPTRGWRSVDLRELWAHRELLYFLAWRDIKVRYKQTVLGAAWAIIQPVTTMLVFTLFFGKLGGLQKQTSVAYPIFVYAALLPWQFFATSVSQSGQSLIAGAHLISKVYFPRLLIPFATLGAPLVDMAISSCVMALLMIWYGVPLTLSALALPLFLLGTIVAVVGVGTLLAALAVAYRDFRHVVPFLVQIWMFSSPVLYPFERVPERWRLAYALNPMAGLISGYRSALLGEEFHWAAIGVSLGVAVALFFVGTVYFVRVERRFADIV
jgi:lipopolysaccharide transport system permease protein